MIPFGNQVVDEIEHIYYTWNAPIEGRPATDEPAADRSKPHGAGADSRLAAADQAGLRHRAPRRGGLEADRAARPGWPAGAGDDLPPRDRLSAQRRLSRLVRPHPHRISPTTRGATSRRAPRFADRRWSRTSQRWRLLATFNAGFIYSDVNNGSTDNGRVNEPLAQGNATLIGYRDGRVAIKIWQWRPERRA